MHGMMIDETNGFSVTGVIASVPFGYPKNFRTNSVPSVIYIPKKKTPTFIKNYNYKFTLRRIFLVTNIKFRWHDNRPAVQQRVYNTCSMCIQKKKNSTTSNT